MKAAWYERQGAARDVLSPDLAIQPISIPFAISISAGWQSDQARICRTHVFEADRSWSASLLCSCCQLLTLLDGLPARFLPSVEFAGGTPYFMELVLFSGRLASIHRTRNEIVRFNQGS
jgi:hypothetical protein